MWTCWHVDVLWMGVDVDPCKKKKKKTKRKEKRKKYILPEVGVSVRMGPAVWKCCRAGVRMGVQTCGHVDVDGCKQKRKKEKTNLAGWACGWVCGRVGVQPCGHADANGCKQKGKKKKTLTNWF